MNDGKLFFGMGGSGTPVHLTEEEKIARAAAAAQAEENTKKLFNEAQEKQIANLEEGGIDFENYKFEEIEEHYKGVEARGYQLLIRVFVPPVQAKTKGGIWLPDDAIQQNQEIAQFGNNTGLVVKLPLAAYKDPERYQYTNEYCRLGEWVHFNRYGAISFRWKGWTSVWLYEDKVLGVVNDPRNISRPTVIK